MAWQWSALLKRLHQNEVVEITDAGIPHMLSQSMVCKHLTTTGLLLQTTHTYGAHAFSADTA